MIKELVLASNALIITPEHKRQMSGNKACGYIMMNPHHFLDLTVSGHMERKHIMDSAQPIDVYNTAAKQGTNIIPPFLRIKQENGKVIGHEGRHRAASVIKAGGKVMPVFLVLSVNGGFQWRLPAFPGDPDKVFEKRLVKATDFPEVALGEFSTYQVKLPLNTWVALDM